MSTRVVHVNDKVGGAVYIGRAMARSGIAGSVFGNPFPVQVYGRERAIKAYADELALIVRREIEPRIDRREWTEQLIALRGMPLACWCRHDGEKRTADNGCHGDTLIELLERHTDDELRAMAEGGMTEPSTGAGGTAPFVTLATEGGCYYLQFTWHEDRQRLVLSLWDRADNRREGLCGVGRRDADALRAFLNDAIVDRATRGGGAE